MTLSQDVIGTYNVITSGINHVSIYCYTLDYTRVLPRFLADFLPGSYRARQGSTRSTTSYYNKIAVPKIGGT